MKIMWANMLALSVTILCFALGAQLAVGAGVVTVDTLIDESDGSCTDGDCSLRDAIQVASSRDTVNFSVAGTISLTEGHLVVSKTLTISGPGAADLAISGNYLGRVFFIESDGVITITDLTIRDGEEVYGAGIYNEGSLSLADCTIADNYAYSGDAAGGGICNNGGIVNVTDCAIVDNAAYDGGGIYSLDGTLTVISSTFSDNAADHDGGGIYNQDLASVDGCTFLGNWAEYGGGIKNEGATLVVTNSTFFDNGADRRGGGIDSGSGSVLALTNSTIFSNTNNGVGNPDSETTAINTIVAGNSDDDCSGGFVEGSSHNLASDDSCEPGFTEVTVAQLALGELTGSPAYFPLLAGSAAIDAGTNDGCPAIDQRGVSRPQAGHGSGTAICDVGSYEALPFYIVRVPLVLRGF